MNQNSLSNYNYISILESELITQTINNWRNLNNVSNIKYHEITEYNNEYKFKITASYRGCYFNFSEMLYLILNVWETQKNKKKEYNICINKDISNYYIYYNVSGHNYDFLFLFN